jgi:hypothetical protein
MKQKAPYFTLALFSSHARIDGVAKSFAPEKPVGWVDEGNPTLARS